MERSELWVDLHCHVLPGMDDGCKTCQESAKLLLESFRQGIYGIVATPHYYPQESVVQFLQRRLTAYESLMEFLRQNRLRVPALCLGAEVAYRDGIAQEPLLDRLCYGKSDYLLLELPFAKWPQRVLEEIQEIILVRGITPVIAHLERYMHYQDRKTLNALYEMDLMIQMNAEYFLDNRTRGKAKKLITGGIVQLLGSDSHNVTRRPPNLGLAIEAMQDRGLEDYVSDIRQNQIRIFIAAARGS